MFFVLVNTSEKSCESTRVTDETIVGNIRIHCLPNYNDVYTLFGSGFAIVILFTAIRLLTSAMQSQCLSSRGLKKFVSFLKYNWPVRFGC